MCVWQSFPFRYRGHFIVFATSYMLVALPSSSRSLSENKLQVAFPIRVVKTSCAVLYKIWGPFGKGMKRYERSYNARLVSTYLKRTAPFLSSYPTRSRKLQEPTFLLLWLIVLQDQTLPTRSRPA